VLPGPGVVLAAGIDFDVLGRGLYWAPLGMAAIEGPPAASMAVWLLGSAQRHLSRPPDRAGRVLPRSSYGAVILQGRSSSGSPVRCVLSGLPGDLKALIVAGAVP
jgi:hypothetical protein